MANTRPEQLIKAQEDVIAQLQQQLLTSGKNTHATHLQIDNTMLKQKVALLEAKITQLTQMLDKKEKTDTILHRDYNCFKVRILDMPWTQVMQPVLDRIPELENIISSKVLTEFPFILYTLQRRIIDIFFDERTNPGITVVQTTRGDETRTNTLRLQINLKHAKMTDDDILSFYHHGMIDYLEFSFNPRTENLLNKLGEKFIVTAGNIATYTDEPSIGCKIFSSFPEATGKTYRPARKRIFLSHRADNKASLKAIGCTTQIDVNSLIFLHPEETTEQLTTWVKEEQKTPNLPYRFKWTEYKLLAEGHYTQIWSHFNWDMLLPFVGESDQISITDINNREYDSEDDPYNQASPPTIPDTHRDF